jgi:hypothetical protein
MPRSTLLPVLLLFAVTGVLLAPDAPAAACPPRIVPPPPPMEGPRGRISIQATPWAQVSIDGQRLGPTPLVGHHLDPGMHRVRLRASCGTWSQRVYVPPSQDVNLSVAVCPGSRVPLPAK